MPPSLEAAAGALQVWQVEADSFRDLVPKALFENAAQMIRNFTPCLSWLFLFPRYYSNVLGRGGAGAQEHVIPSQVCWYLEPWLWASPAQSVRPKQN